MSVRPDSEEKKFVTKIVITISSKLYTKYFLNHSESDPRFVSEWVERMDAEKRKGSDCTGCKQCKVSEIVLELFA